MLNLEKYLCALCSVWKVPLQNNRLPLFFKTAGRVSAYVVSGPPRLPQVVRGAADSGQPPSETEQQ